MLRHYWNKPVVTIKDQNGNVLHNHLSFPEICKRQLALEVSTRSSSVSIESWILYLSMRDAKAFGPFTYSPESHAEILGYAGAFYTFKTFKQKLSELPEVTREEIEPFFSEWPDKHLTEDGSECWFWKDVKWYTGWPEHYPDIDFVNKFLEDADECYFIRIGEDYEDNEISGDWWDNPFDISFCRETVLDC